MDSRSLTHPHTHRWRRKTWFIQPNTRTNRRNNDIWDIIEIHSEHDSPAKEGQGRQNYDYCYLLESLCHSNCWVKISLSLTSLKSTTITSNFQSSTKCPPILLTCSPILTIQRVTNFLPFYLKLKAIKRTGHKLHDVGKGFYRWLPGVIDGCHLSNSTDQHNSKPFKWYNVIFFSLSSSN